MHFKNFFSIEAKLQTDFMHDNDDVIFICMMNSNAVNTLFMLFKGGQTFFLAFSYFTDQKGLSEYVPRVPLSFQKNN